MSKIPFNLILLFFILSFNTSFSQNKIIDSLKLVVKKEKNDSLKIKAYCDLCYYYGNISIDSAFIFGKNALELSKKTKNFNGKAQALNDIGILYYRTAKYDSANVYYHKSLEIRKKNKDTLGTASLYNKLGISFQKSFKMDSAIHYSTKALKIYEEKKKDRFILIIKNNIANIYKSLKQYNKSLNAHLEIAKLSEKINDQNGLVRSYTNIGNSYLLLKDTTRSLEYYKKGINIAEKNNLTRPLSTLYNNYGSLLKDKKQFKNAINFYSKSLKIRNKLSDNYGIASSSLGLADIYLTTNQIRKAKKNISNGLKIAKRIKAIELEMKAYNNFISYYAKTKDSDSILHYKNLYQIYQDSIFNTRITKEVAEVQEKYNTAEKEKEILQQKEQLLQSEVKIKNRNFYTVLLGAGILILGIVSYGTLKYQKNKRKQLKKQLDLKEKLATAETENKLQKQRLRISRDLHDNIGSQLTFIISSIDNVNLTLKTEDDNLKNRLNNINDFASSTISQLRDTIWAMNKDKITLKEFHSRVLSFIEKAKSIKKSTSFELSNTITRDLTLSSANGINIFRIVQESINNAIKYAEATVIKVTINETTNNLEFIVSDNGKGFDINAVELGHGLENMQKRVQEIKGELDINSKPKKGTTIKVTLNKNTKNYV